MKSTKPSRTEQSKRFVETARQLGCSEDENAFETALKKVASARVQKPSNKPKKKTSAS